MCFTFKKNNKQTKIFFQDDASAGIQCLQTSDEKKTLPKPLERTVQSVPKNLGHSDTQNPFFYAFKVDREDHF